MNIGFLIGGWCFSMINVQAVSMESWNDFVLSMSREEPPIVFPGHNAAISPRLIFWVA